jgi:hypothetical protein
LVNKKKTTNKTKQTLSQMTERSNDRAIAERRIRQAAGGPLLHVATIRRTTDAYCGHALAQLVATQRYKSEGRGFDSRSCRNFFIDIILPVALWLWVWLSLWQKWVPGIYPEGKGGRCAGLTTLPPSCAECLEILEPQHPETLRACPDL